MPSPFATLKPVGANPSVPSGLASMRECHRQLSARSDARAISPSAYLVDSVTGASIRIEVTAGAVRFWGPPSASSEVDDLIWAIARPLARSLRWGLVTTRGVVDYVPDQPCPQCGVPVFDDEDRCPACAKKPRVGKLDRVVDGFARLLAEELNAPVPESARTRFRTLFRNGIDETPERLKSELARLSIESEALSPKRLTVLAAWARRGASLKVDTLFCVRPPAPDEALGFHQPSRLRPLELSRLASAPRVVRCDAHAAVLHARSGHALLLHAHEGVVRLAVHRHSFGDDRVAKAEVRELAELIAGELQDQSGAYVFSGETKEHPHLDHERTAGDVIDPAFMPAGACVSCGQERFERQEWCARCGLARSASALDCRIATATIGALLAAAHIELSVAVDEAARALASAMRSSRDPAQLAALLFALDEIEDVFGADSELAAVIGPVVDETVERTLREWQIAPFDAVNALGLPEGLVEVQEGTVTVTFAEPIPYPPPSATVTFHGVHALELTIDPNEETIAEPFVRAAKDTEVGEIPVGTRAYCVATNAGPLPDVPVLVVVARKVEVDVPDGDARTILPVR